MKLNDLKSSDSMTFPAVACRLLSPQRILSSEGRIRHSGGSRFELITKDVEAYAFEIEDQAVAEEIVLHMRQRRQNLAQVLTAQRGNAAEDRGIFYLYLVFFGAVQRIGTWYVSLDGAIKAQLQNMRLGKTPEEIEQAVIRNFRLSNGSRDCFAMTIGKYNPEEFAPADPAAAGERAEEREDREAWLDTAAESPAFGREKSIVIYGMDFSLLVRVQGSEGEAFLRAVRIDRRNRRRPAMTLAIGELIFQDHQNLIGEQVRKQLRSFHGYLDLWARYASAEGNYLLKRARAVGAFGVKASAVTPRGLELYPQGLAPEGWEQLKPDDQLMFSSGVPIYLQEDMTWDEYQAYLDDLSAAKQETGAPVQSDTEKGESLAILDVRPNDGCILLNIREGEEPQGKTVSLSIRGDKAKIDRRRDARNRIDNAESENPSLGLIIEGKLPALSEESGAQRRIEPLSPFVKNKIFEYPPTQTQTDAISIALNTPDIAIIQGPPGTGKTTVITAIIERLNELADHRRANPGSVLVTSFQHDAVRNVTSRLRINSLPTIKFGRKGTEDPEAETVLSDWCEEYAGKLRALHPGLRETEEQKELMKLRAAYIAHPGDENALRILEFAKTWESAEFLGGEISGLMESLEQDAYESGSGLLPKIRRLRVSREAFLDDGPDAADDLLHDLRRKFPSEPSGRIARIFDILDQAADCFGEPEESLLRELKAVQRELLQSCIPMPPYHQEKPREEILRLCDRLEKLSRRPADEKDQILLRLLSELESNPDRVRETVSAYNYVYAATTLQSEGTDIRRAKKTQKDEHPAYDSVVIDEAARVSPVDLLIPMAQARHRIILVGDHRQLPHIYDEEIFENMQTDGIDVDKNVVKESMFQYLFQKAGELTRQDHIPRTITLNAQYRMHPMLGNFISDQFYAPYGEGFQSPRPASEFQQGLWHKPLKWAHLPAGMGPPERAGTSRTRSCEANYIAETLQQYLASPEGQGLSYGVITFYSGQRDLIARRLRQKLGDGAKKIRVGTVDAFQGMEFDVIFLSVVRCRAGEVRADPALLEQEAGQGSPGGGEFVNWDEARQKAGMRHYGFLISENRLCVALSRQKKLLIIVGDADAFLNGSWGKLARLCVPAMRRLAELCKSEGVLIDGKA